MFLFICLFIVLCLYSFIWFPFFYLFPTTRFLCNCIYIYLFFYFFIHLFVIALFYIYQVLILVFRLVCQSSAGRYWTVLPVPFRLFLPSLSFLFLEVGRSGSMLSGMAFWLLPVPSALFFCLGAVVQPFLLRAFRVVMYLSCIQTAVVYLVWYFVVDTLFCLIPAASLSRCVWCLLVEWGTMAWLQALPWELPTEKVTSRIGFFLIFPFTVYVLFSFDFLFWYINI